MVVWNVALGLIYGGSRRQFHSDQNFSLAYRSAIISSDERLLVTLVVFKQENANPPMSQLRMFDLR